jgi:hypothetical protein
MRGLIGCLALLVIIATVAMSFSDSVHDRRRQHYQCLLGSLTRFPDDYLVFSPINNGNIFLQDCMGAVGYELRADAECPQTVGSRIWLDRCYAPTGYPAKWRQKLETLLGY